MQNSCIFSIKDFHLYVTTTLLMSKNVGKWSEGIRLCFYSYCRVCDIVIICYTYVLLCGLPPSCRFLSVQDGIHALGNSHMRSTPSVRRFPNVAFKTAPVFV